MCFVFLNDIKLHEKFMLLFRMKVFNGSFHGSTKKMIYKKKILVFLGRKTEFYQRLKVEDNTICLGYDFWAVRFGLTSGLGLINLAL